MTTENDLANRHDIDAISVVQSFEINTEDDSTHNCVGLFFKKKEM